MHIHLINGLVYGQTIHLLTGTIAPLLPTLTIQLFPLIDFSMRNTMQPNHSVLIVQRTFICIFILFFLFLQRCVEYLFLKIIRTLNFLFIIFYDSLNSNNFTLVKNIFNVLKSKHTPEVFLYLDIILSTRL